MLPTSLSPRQLQFFSFFCLKNESQILEEMMTTNFSCSVCEELVLRLANLGNSDKEKDLLFRAFRPYILGIES